MQIRRWVDEADQILQVFDHNQPISPSLEGKQKRERSGENTK
jgi:hypothetical protein